MNENSTILEVRQLSFSYGQRQALKEVSFSVSAGKILAILGPNGSGKSTLFKILSTLVPIQQGEVICSGLSYLSDVSRARSLFGVVFQSPGLDKKLTVRENLACQAFLYGMGSVKADEQIAFWMKRLRIDDRAGDYVEKLSGGLARRVEIAKALLHQPKILILDEPSTGLDPRSRSELWDALTVLSQQDGVTILVTTHLMDEAKKSDRVLILDNGSTFACDSPEALVERCPHEVLTLKTQSPMEVESYLISQFSLEPKQVSSGVRTEIKSGNGAQIIADVSRQFGSTLQAITLSQSGLEDVFFALTGKSFGEEGK